MADYKVWCWEAAQHGAGPDWLFIAHVISASEPALAALALNTTLHEYVAFNEEVAHCSAHQQPCRQRTFVDESSSSVYAENLQGTHKQNIWVYNIVQIHRDTLEVLCGYGGRGEAYNQIETTFLLNALATPGLTLYDWCVIVGGEGYEYKMLREGTDVASLRAYLT